MNELPEVIPAPLRAFLELYEETLKDVAFPDVDAEALAQAATRVSTASELLARAREAVAAAEAELEAQQEALLGKAQRAIAYARVYAEDQPELASRLAAISLPRANKKPRAEPTALATGTEPTAPKRRGRPPKVRTEQPASLFGEQVSADTVVAMPLSA